MNLLNKIANGWNKLKDKFVSKPKVEAAPGRMYPRYLHISKPLIEVDAGLQPVLGVRWLVSKESYTRRNGNNEMKHRADELARDLGLPNKMRRRLRSRMKRRAAELRAGAPLLAGVA